MKRKKVITAGRVVWSYIYSVPKPQDKGKVRASKMQCSSKARQQMNHRRATGQLEMLLNANFTEKDLKCELTYREKDLPSYDESKKCIDKFIRLLRAVRKKRGDILKYIYVTEHKHARIHHHLVINGTSANDLEEIKNLWAYGDIVQVDYLWDTGEYSGLANYLTKENKEDKSIYSRRYNCSLNLTKPTIESRIASSDESITVPAGCYSCDDLSMKTEYGEYQYIKYILPIKEKVKPRRKKRE